MIQKPQRKEKKKRRRDRNHEAITDRKQSELNIKLLSCMMIHIMDNFISNYACFGPMTNLYCFIYWTLGLFRHCVQQVLLVL